MCHRLNDYTAMTTKHERIKSCPGVVGSRGHREGHRHMKKNLLIFFKQKWWPVATVMN